MATNKEIAQNILNAVGGAENVKDATHCMTRLRLMLKDDQIPKDDEVKAIPGILSVVRGGQQYQIVIGPNVPKVYDEFCALTGLAQKAAVEDAGAAAQDAALASHKPKLTPLQIGKNIIGYMAGCMTPMIPVLIAGGLFRAVNAILGPDMLNLYPAESNTYILFEFLYNAALYFMPILAGVNAARQLGLNQMLGAYIGCILMAPGFMALAGQPFTVFGIPCITGDYSQTVLPIMMSVYVLSLIYKFIKKYMPDALATVLTPFLAVLITTPISLCLLAPLGTICGNAISGGLAWFGNTTGFLGVAVIAALWEFLVMTGMHMALMMPLMSSFFETGIASGPMMSGGFATWACFGVALGAALRLKNQERSASLGAFISGIVGGVTEPTLYGICFKYTRCFATLVFSGFVSGAYAGIFDVKGYNMGGTNFTSLVSYVGGPTSNLVHGVIACLLAMVVATVTTYLFGFTKKDLETK